MVKFPPKYAQYHSFKLLFLVVKVLSPIQQGLEATSILLVINRKRLLLSTS